MMDLAVLILLNALQQFHDGVWFIHVCTPQLPLSPNRNTFTIIASLITSQKISLETSLTVVKLLGTRK